MTLSSLDQRARKLAQLERCLRNAGVAVDPSTIAFTPSPLVAGYRNRIRLRIDQGRVRFFNERKAPTCVVLEPELRGRLASLLELSTRAPELFAPFQHLELRSDDDQGYPGLALGGTARPPRVENFLVGVRGDPDIACQRRTIVDGVWTFVPLDGFLQINTRVNAALVSAIRDGARARGFTSALDLFAGSGNFGLPLAAAGVHVTAVETHAPSVAALARAAAAQRLFLEPIAEAAHEACAQLARSGRTFELVIVDAPRAGARDTLPAMLQLRPRAVVLCSCNVETMARDAAQLAVAGCELEALHLFDMFPHTHHVEAVAWFRR